MHQTLSEPVSVTFNKIPTTITWAGRDYPVSQLGLHHTYLQGRTLQHIYSVLAGGLFFRLRLDTASLHWTLEEISDGLS